MPLTAAELAVLRSRDPYLHGVLTKIVEHINKWQQQSGVSPAGQLPAPPAIGGISVTAANGWFDVTITDKSASQPGIQYFVEYDTQASFANARTEALGPSRAKHFHLGNLTLYWRAYSSFQGSQSSVKVNFGNPPIGVAGGGATAPPAFQPTQGSGTSQTPGQGFGTPPNQIQGAKPVLR